MYPEAVFAGHVYFDPEKSPCRNCLRQYQFYLPLWQHRILNERRATAEQPDSSRAAVGWLRAYLQDGPKPSGNKDNPISGTVIGDAIATGFTYTTIGRAADELGIHKGKIGKRWYWALPPD